MFLSDSRTQTVIIVTKRGEVIKKLQNLLLVCTIMINDPFMQYESKLSTIHNIQGFL